MQDQKTLSRASLLKVSLQAIRASVETTAELSSSGWQARYQYVGSASHQGSRSKAKRAVDLSAAREIDAQSTQEGFRAFKKHLCTQALKSVSSSEPTFIDNKNDI